MPFSNEQLKAIQHMSGPALVLAGPGSGKTTVLTKRAANLIEHNVNPKNILIITFTKNSANEMKADLLINIQIRMMSLRYRHFLQFIHWPAG